MSKKNQDESANDVLRPFLGLRSFEEGNQSQFGGRDDEIIELFEQIEDNHLNVVFGKSGIGKTSLLRAGLIPKLRKSFYFPIYIRIDFSATTSPLHQIKEQAYQAMHDKDSSVPPVENRSLWEYFHDVNFSNGLITPVLIFDQFEEIFTVGKKNAELYRFVKELSDMAENRIPLTVQDYYRKKGETVPTRYSAQPYRVVFGLREDFLPQLEELKRYMPSLMDSRFRVVQMTITQAMDAAIKPGKGLIDESVAKAIIKKLPGISQSDFETAKNEVRARENFKVEPFLLSFICDRINEDRISQGLEKFTLSLVKSFEVRDAIKSFYNGTLSKYDLKVEHGIEDLLLTQEGFRKLQPLNELQSKYVISDETIDELIEARILRKENREGIEYIELIHDVLTDVISEKRNHRIAQQEEMARLEALKNERDKNRRRLIQVGSVLGLILIAISGFAYWQSSIVSQNREEKIRKARARELLNSAISMSIYEGTKKGHSALLARHAYGLYKQDRENLSGINESDRMFYNGMLASAFDIIFEDREKFHKLLNTYAPVNHTSGNSGSDTIASAQIDKYGLRPRDIVLVDNTTMDDYYLIALGDKTVRKLTLNDAINIDQEPEYARYDAEEPVSSIAYDSKKRRLAVASQRTIQIYEQDMKIPKDSIHIPDMTNSKYNKSYFINFMPDQSLCLALGKNLYKWDSTLGRSLAWTERKRSNWKVGTENLKIEIDTIGQPRSEGSMNDDSVVQFTDSTLTFSEDILDLAVSKNSLIALATKKSLFFIEENEIVNISYDRWQEITALSFDALGQNLIIGDSKGGIYSIEIPVNLLFKDSQMKKHFAHSKRVLDIASTPKMPNMVASSSQDGSVAIWNIKNDTVQKVSEWSALILDAAIFNVEGYPPARKISFSKNGGYLIVVYDNGKLIRWPSSLDKLNEEICKMIEKAELVDTIPEIVKRENNILATDYSSYCCACNSQHRITSK